MEGEQPSDEQSNRSNINNEEFIFINDVNEHDEFDNSDYIDDTSVSSLSPFTPSSVSVSSDNVDYSMVNVINTNSTELPSEVPTPGPSNAFENYREPNDRKRPSNEMKGTYGKRARFSNQNIVTTTSESSELSSSSSSEEDVENEYNRGSHLNEDDSRDEMPSDDNDSDNDEILDMPLPLLSLNLRNGMVDPSTIRFIRRPEIDRDSGTSDVDTENEMN